MAPAVGHAPVAPQLFVYPYTNPITVAYIIDVWESMRYRSTMMTINKFGGIAKDISRYNDTGATALQISSTDPDSYDAAKKRIVCLAKPKDPDDAVTMGYIDNRILNMSRDLQQYMRDYFVDKIIFDKHVQSSREMINGHDREKDVFERLIAPLLESITELENRIDINQRAIEGIIAEQKKRKLDNIDTAVEA